MTTRSSAGWWATAWVSATGLAAVTLLAAVVVTPGRAQASDGSVACCDTGTCSVVTPAVNCNHPADGSPTSCSGVACSGCCQNFGGNPKACDSELGEVACRQANGTFMAHAHCTSDMTSPTCIAGSLDGVPCSESTQCLSGLCNGGVCVERSPAPAVSNRNAIFVGVGLLLAGLWSVRRLARRR